MQKTSEERVYLENEATDARLRLEGRLRELFERRRYWAAAARRVAHPPTTALLMAALGVTAIALIAQRTQRRLRRALQRPKNARAVALTAEFRQGIFPSDPREGGPLAARRRRSQAGPPRRGTPAPSSCLPR
jgi:hypothetical protein